MTNSLYQIRLFFERGGPCLWADNAAAKNSFGYAISAEKLPLSAATLRQLDALVDLHDTALNWGDPAAASPWSQDQFVRFSQEAQSILLTLQEELGATFHVWYQPD
ncbi:hypothetical protein NBRC116594_34140 [Shimia sp. NS0008-38b]|uniref:hypothetical protein n=1 Tax=Shimia sp. NS0008-38b TaxID=3127653 RepID=UPI0031020A04